MCIYIYIYVYMYVVSQPLQRARLVFTSHARPWQTESPLLGITDASLPTPPDPDPREDPKSRSLNGGSYKVPLVV